MYPSSKKYSNKKSKSKSKINSSSSPYNEFFKKSTSLKQNEFLPLKEILNNASNKKSEKLTK